MDRVFSSQSDAAGADDDHNEQIKVAKVDDEVTETTNSEMRKQSSAESLSILHSVTGVLHVECNNCVFLVKSEYFFY